MGKNQKVSVDHFEIFKNKHYIKRDLNSIKGIN